MTLTVQTKCDVYAANAPQHEAMAPEVPESFWNEFMAQDTKALVKELIPIYQKPLGSEDGGCIDYLFQVRRRSGFHHGSTWNHE